MVFCEIGYSQQNRIIIYHPKGISQILLISLHLYQHELHEMPYGNVEVDVIYAPHCSVSVAFGGGACKSVEYICSLPIRLIGGGQGWCLLPCSLSNVTMTRAIFMEIMCK